METTQMRTIMRLFPVALLLMADTAMADPITIGALISAAAATATAIATTSLALASIAALTFFAKAFAIAYAAGFLLKTLAKKPSQPEVGGAGSAVKGSTRGLSGTVIPKRWVVGRAKISGALVWFRDLDTRWGMVLVLAEGELDRIEKIYAAGEEIEMVRSSSGVHTPAPGSRHTVIETQSRSYQTQETYQHRTGGSGRDGFTYETRTRTVTRTRDVKVAVPAITITEYFAADGTEGAAVRAFATRSIPNEAATGENTLPWTTDHKLTGVSYVYVELFQPEYDDLEDRFWSSLPALEFLVRGMKLSYPVADTGSPGGRRMTTPAWSDNAAVIWYWYLTTRRNINQGFIDLGYFTAARLKCDETLRLDNQTGYQSEYPESVKRYTINGSISADDASGAIERQFNLCWQGNAVEWSGMFLFRPGSEQPVRYLISERDIIEPPIISPSLSREDRANEVSIQIEQSAASDYQAQRFIVADPAKQASDGERLPIDLQTQQFLTEPVQAINIIHQTLRQLSFSMGVEIVVMPRDDWRYIDLIPGDKVELSLPEYGIGQGEAGSPGASSIRYFRVIRNEVTPTWAVKLNLLQWPDDWFADTFDFPPVVRRFFPRSPPPAAPEDLAAFTSFNIADDGTVTWTIQVFWKPNAHRTSVILSSPGIADQVQATYNDRTTFQTSAAGEYLVSAKNVSRDGKASRSVTTTVTVSSTDLPLPNYFVRNVDQRGNNLHIQISPVPNREIDGVEVRYVRGATTTNLANLAVLTDANWATANEMDVAPLIPRADNEDIYVNAAIPGTGAYRVFIRLRNRFGDLSPIAEVGTFVLQIADLAASFQSEFPEWPGTRENMYRWVADGLNYLIPDRHDKDAVTLDEWNGAPDWPFGQQSGYGMAYTDTGEHTAYMTRPIELGVSRARHVNVTVRAATPPAAAQNVRLFDITIFHSDNADLSNSTPVVAVNGQSYLFTARYIQVRVHLRTARSQALTGVTVGWRETV